MKTRHVERDRRHRKWTAPPVMATLVASGLFLMTMGQDQCCNPVAIILTDPWPTAEVSGTVTVAAQTSGPVERVQFHVPDAVPPLFQEDDDGFNGWTFDFDTTAVPFDGPATVEILAMGGGCSAAYDLELNLDNRTSVTLTILYEETGQPVSGPVEIEAVHWDTGEVATCSDTNGAGQASCELLPGAHDIEIYFECCCVDFDLGVVGVGSSPTEITLQSPTPGNAC